MCVLGDKPNINMRYKATQQLRRTLFLLCFSALLVVKSGGLDGRAYTPPGSSAGVRCTMSDSLVLVDLYNATNGPRWTVTWDLGQPMRFWHGVRLTAEGCVRELLLNDNNLGGTLPASLGNLSSLQTLWLQNNNLSGSIPPELGNLNSIQRLYLSHNSLA